MTRRGVIAALATVTAAFTQDRQEQQKLDLGFGTVTTGNVIKQRPMPVELYLQDDGGEPYMGMTGFSQLTVRYRGRSVTLTAAEIMDALEPGKRNV